MTVYTVGTRGSRLSLAQTGHVLDALKEANPEDEYKVRRIKTQGDTDDRPLFAIDQKGIFEKEIDRAVSEGGADFAVHSLKDVPTELAPGLVLACVPRRAAANDVLVSPGGSGLGSLPRGATVGTSSLRRAVQVGRSRSDLHVKPVRGNIETRIAKVGAGYDAVVLAEAGISRLGLDVKYAALPEESFAPSPGQGSLALVARSGDAGTISMLNRIEDAASRAEAEAERALSERIGSGCRFPVGALARSAGELLTIRAEAFSVDGSRSVSVQASGPRGSPRKVGESAGNEMLERGAGDLALNWREKVDEWNRS
ncbi:porphobilinogen deaminase [Cenarchaeum symbiosum A]|uniref:Probable porphobilinogen deaminase n=1 Tax=Cenarchaeum symbiosum (strain A) TaxID=414004 RepID=A0RXB2_CENSY|nr:porphobilinogen deaminase [Cenarchaeum symbiosum A]